MLRTEEKARESLCPQTFNSESRRECVGTSCMWWRKSTASHWQTPEGLIYKVDREPRSGRGHWVDVGYCGIAGEPK